MEWHTWPSEASTPETDLPVKESVSEVEEPPETILERVLTFSSLGKTAEAGSLTATNIWRSVDAHPLVLSALLMNRYGADYLEWDPTALRLSLEKDGTPLSNAVWTKILAARPIFTSPGPWRRWEIFHWVCRGLAGRSPNFTYFEQPEMGHLAAGFEMMRLIDPGRSAELEVEKFVAVVFRMSNIPWIPEPLSFAQRELENPQLHCQSCGAHHRDDDDVRCITCGSRKLDKIPFAFAERREETRLLFEKFQHRPLESVLGELPETSAGAAVERLLVHWSYARDVGANLKQQSALVR